MTRENKLALIVGFSLLLVVAVLLADHLSPAQRDQLANLEGASDAGPGINLPAGSGSEFRRQFGGRESEAAPQPAQRQPIRMERPNEAMQIDRNAPGDDDPIQRISEFEGNGGLTAPGFGEHINGGNQQPEPIEMGTKVLPPSSDATPPADLGDATPYTVKDRDTLYGLCKQFYGDGSLYEKLQRFNGDAVPSNGRIRTGMTLWIPARHALDGRGNSNPPRTPTQPPTERPAKNIKTVNYTIKENDRLWDIAKDHLGKGHRYKEIVELNRDIITNEDVLPVGKTIRIPAQ